MDLSKEKVTPKPAIVESQKESLTNISDSSESDEDEENSENSQSNSSIDWKKVTKEFNRKKRETASSQEQPSREGQAQEKRPLSKKIMKQLKKLDHAAQGGKARTQDILNLLSLFAMQTPGSSMGFNGGSEYRTVIGNDTLKVDLNHGSIRNKMTRGRVNLFKDFITERVLDKGVFEDFEEHS